MFDFEKLLEQELPSKANATYEGVGCEDSDNCDPIDGIDTIEDEVEKDLEDIDVSDIDPDDISEDDLSAIDDDEDEEELDDDEASEADQMMGLVATPLLLDKELTEESVLEAFIEEIPMVMTEGLLLESDADMFFETDMEGLMTEKRVFAAKTRVQFSEKDRRKQLFEVGVQASARAHNDPIYWKLQKCYKLERMYKAKLRQKYRGEALRRVKAYVKRLKASSSKILNGLGNKITGK